MLLDALDRGARRGDLHAHRITEQAPGQRGDVLRHGGAEEQGLALPREALHHLADVPQEAHVEHAVGLVQDEDLHIGEVHVPLAHQIEQAAGGGHQDVDAAVQGLHLTTLADAAEDDSGAESKVLAVAFEVVVDLGGELPRRGEHECARAARTGALVVLVQEVEDGQRKGCGLAGARLGDAQEIPAIEQMRNGLGLDRRRVLVPLVADGVQEVRAEVEVGEGRRLGGGGTVAPLGVRRCTLVGQ